MSILSALWDPFASFGFMRRALVASMTLGMGAGPVGVMLQLRRMSLIGDAMSHAILPGAAIGFLLAGGLSLTAMGIGGIAAGLGVALLAGLVSRRTQLAEDASFASFYLTSLALGVLIVSARGSNIDLLHVLFGTILGIDASALCLMGGITTLSIVMLSIIWRPLVMECVDPGFMRMTGGRGGIYHMVFLFLVVINLVAGFEALGTLMSVGMMMVPAATARLWTRRLLPMMVLSAATGMAAGLIGLLVSYHYRLAAGPSIILTCSVLYILSLVMSPAGLRAGRHVHETS
ncbi:ABC transporter Mn2+/Zn2+ permease [Komagataeibacter europaeus NBRC 3261]|uniref:ABC transporter Mn2+/Zn2+ permease n=1 Tax=Komagataeibacter europaeus NBRC 3261 TaxID=1234669 RepID=A0A0D6PX59_KOMEU|nr:metal ABC transporter permease [Komagataeibacter europaeus]GAN95096.1 ABC transporter Mn2+/Zn2+ permease [Komagataeibacter europaeus NBRC 3261]